MLPGKVAARKHARIDSKQEQPHSPSSLTLCVLSSRFAAATQDMTYSLPKEVFQISDLFRSKFCYMEQTDASLLRHIITLKSIYEKYSELNDDPHNKLQHRRLMSCGEWITLVEHLGFVSLPSCSSFSSPRIGGLWSRLETEEEGFPLCCRLNWFRRPQSLRSCV